ncbi:MFS transporter [Pseudoalteromonas lipolytica]|uniref:MFS transporter n=1 Tax=Pseudoalteromonas lipolytica TaxID=570156 RepID=A0AAD0S0X8_9GAMM|nr:MULTISPECIES: MFS transporter [Pseudoalteromonas]AXV66124.1 MFS transporter [Pseudoalteromonas donghaensis]MBE0350476.1 MFS transporter, CP family, cyanate transporter [Pseudoalteromonas lipolytica LMEB 39]SFT63875.1 MFS transporter, CP family, cyanate transporter [Pseudoalteromonas lipolytica]
MPSSQNAIRTLLLVLGIFLIAASLRAPITGIAPVLEQIIEQFKLTASQAGMLTTLPLIAFAIASPMAASLAKKYGLELSLFIALLLIGVGVLSRLIDSASVLFIGTAVIGVGIAIGNVLLPSLIKRDFSHKVAVMTSSYVLAMGIFGGSYSALITPLAEYKEIGWQVALASYSLLVLLAIVVWLPQLKQHTMPSKAQVSHTTQAKVWHSPLAWQITLLLGFNSFFTYIMLGWLPSILIEFGHTAEHAGALQGAFQVASALPGIVLIPLLAKLNDQRILTFSLALLGALCSFGLLYAPSFAMIWSVTLGFCSGACFILGLSFVSLRTHNAQQAAALSGMAQCIGYLLAATGPILAGTLHSFFNNWAGALWLCIVSSLLCALFGYLSGRNVTINNDVTINNK